MPYLPLPVITEMFWGPLAGRAGLPFHDKNGGGRKKGREEKKKKVEKENK